MNHIIKMILLLLSLTLFECKADTIQENTKACDAGNIYGCLELGAAYSIGKGVKQDYFKANTYFTKACNAGNADGCLTLSFAYQSGEGVRQSSAKARNLARKAKELYGKDCDLGDNEGCKYYAMINKYL